uniref:Uncharacterized protein n=1 Tax=Rangifer tarandus platyrhynchus TaxID=3082113 RepID=A0ACB0FFH2_RANTA|nr:unnamed protein product [Rangifer tarandus platyrhynchus]
MSFKLKYKGLPWLHQLTPDPSSCKKTASARAHGPVRRGAAIPGGVQSAAEGGRESRLSGASRPLGWARVSGLSESSR